MYVRAIRGATTIENNLASEIEEATKELLKEIVFRNDINESDIISVIFSTTKDVDKDFPAKAARKMGWTDIALMSTNEMEVEGSLTMCIRVLMHINTVKTNQEIKYVYLRKARILRPDKAD